MKEHDVKCINPYFTWMWNDIKPFDIRKDDRNYQVGEIIRQHEFDSVDGYSGRIIICTVLSKIPVGTYEGLPPGYCAMGVSINKKIEGS